MDKRPARPARDVSQAHEIPCEIHLRQSCAGFLDAHAPHCFAPSSSLMTKLYLPLIISAASPEARCRLHRQAAC